MVCQRRHNAAKAPVMSRFASVLLWSAIAAAFIGPGTVTAAASAGAGFGLALLWAILFSGLATFVLQEFSARLAIAADRDLAAVLRKTYQAGASRLLVLALAGGAILLGCAAYEAGNILGGAAGAMLALELPRWLVTLFLAGVAGLLLLAGSPQRIARIMAGFVAIMGFGFVLVAVSLAPLPGELLAGTIPDFAALGASEVLLTVLALVGTTVVPYNLFLGSALARGQDVATMRWGLAVAVGIGAVITVAILIVGSVLEGEFSFEALADAVAAQLGEWARYGLGLGLLAAGLSSAITAPLAAALTARGLFGDKDAPGWQAGGSRFRAVWAGVLLIGLGFGLADIRPAPAIIAAQAFNGALLPLVALFLLRAMNDGAMLADHANRAVSNLFGVLVVAVATTLGLTALARAGSTLLSYALPAPAPMLAVFALVGLLVGLFAAFGRPSGSAATA